MDIDVSQVEVVTGATHGFRITADGSPWERWHPAGGFLARARWGSHPQLAGRDARSQ